MATLTFELIQDIVKVNVCTKFWVCTSNGSAVRELTDAHTHTHRQTGPISYPRPLTREGIKVTWAIWFQPATPHGGPGGQFRFSAVWSQQWIWVQTPENQEGGPWPLWYMESWNHMAHGPCFLVLSMTRVCQQVGAPLWFSPTLPLKNHNRFFFFKSQRYFAHQFLSK